MTLTLMTPTRWLEAHLAIQTLHYASAFLRTQLFFVSFLNVLV